MGMEKAAKYFSSAGCENSHIAPSNTIVIENAPLGVQAGIAAGCFTIAVNTGPLPDSALLDQGANILFHSMQELADSWDELLQSLKSTNA
jgi:beta-phosphoglucomutase-like phosphatase (HAD superfamily)